MATIAIVGPGAVGGVVAGCLALRRRHDLTLCARRPLNGLVVELLTVVVPLAVPVLVDPKLGHPVDWVLVTTKTYDAEGAAAWFPKLVGPQTIVAVLQNGVEHRERFAPFVDPAKILPVMVDVPAERPAPGRIVQRGPGRMAVPAGSAGANFAELFVGTALEVTPSADFKTAAWRKLCLNSAGIISALLLKPAGVMRDKDIGILAGELIRECIAVGRAEGAVLDDSLTDTIMESYRKAPVDAVNSLQADRAAGRPMEIDARNGAVIRFGHKHGIPTPYNQTAAILLAAM